MWQLWGVSGYHESGLQQVLLTLGLPIIPSSQACAWPAALNPQTIADSALARAEMGNSPAVRGFGSSVILVVKFSLSFFFFLSFWFLKSQLHEVKTLSTSFARLVRKRVKFEAKVTFHFRKANV